MTPPPVFGWRSVARLGLVQAALGGIVVLAISTLNRVMVVELALPALVPGGLVALHYLVQVLRPRMGHGSDRAGRRTPWIVGGMGALALGVLGAALATAWMATDRGAGAALAVLAYAAIGLGASASGTSLLVLLAQRVDEPRRAAAATLVWLMMIAGIALTAAVAGRLLDPYTTGRMLAITAGAALTAWLLTVAALYRLEGAVAPRPASGGAGAPRTPFSIALAQVWAEPAARRFTIFVFLSMLAYSAQELILEPFAGAAFGYTPGASTRLSGLQHGGVLVGMILVALAASGAAIGVRGRTFGRPIGSLTSWTVGGCVASALALMGLAGAAMVGPGWPLRATVFALGAANGAFSIGTIGSMMRMAGDGRERREGVRMGLWGAAQAVAFGLGGLIGSGASDLARRLLGAPGPAYGAVFLLEAVLFLVAAAVAVAARDSRQLDPAVRPSRPARPARPTIGPAPTWPDPGLPDRVQGHRAEPERSTPASRTTDTSERSEQWRNPMQAR
jgi:BCD family chlorophyll transporter-like MFS transporter